MRRLRFLRLSAGILTAISGSNARHAIVRGTSVTDAIISRLASTVSMPWILKRTRVCKVGGSFTRTAKRQSIFENGYPTYAKAERRAGGPDATVVAPHKSACVASSGVHLPLGCPASALLGMIAQRNYRT